MLYLRQQIYLEAIELVKSFFYFFHFFKARCIKIYDKISMTEFLS
jgi:hypothetical protein